MFTNIGLLVSHYSNNLRLVVNRIVFLLLEVRLLDASGNCKQTVMSSEGWSEEEASSPVLTSADSGPP